MRGHQAGSESAQAPVGGSGSVFDLTVACFIGGPSDRCRRTGDGARSKRRDDWRRDITTDGCSRQSDVVAITTGVADDEGSSAIGR